MCPCVENPDLVCQKTGYSQSPTYSRPAECGRRQAIQARPDHPNRVVSPSRGLPSNVQDVAVASDIPFCNKVQQQTGSMCVTSTRPHWRSAANARSLPWEHLDPYDFPTTAILGKVVEKLQDYPCRRIILITPELPNMPWPWVLVAMPSQIPLCLPNLPNLLTQPFNPRRNLSNLNLHAWLL